MHNSLILLLLLPPLISTCPSFLPRHTFVSLLCFASVLWEVHSLLGYSQFAFLFVGCCYARFPFTFAYLCDVPYESNGQMMLIRFDFEVRTWFTSSTSSRILLPSITIQITREQSSKSLHMFFLFSIKFNQSCKWI